jgi:integrase
MKRYAILRHETDGSNMSAPGAREFAADAGPPTAARLWLQAGQRRPGHAQHYLGHKNIQHTVRYTTGCLRPAEKRLTAFRRWRAAHPEPARYEPPGSGHEAEGGRSSRP